MDQKKEKLAEILSCIPKTAWKFNNTSKYVYEKSNIIIIANGCYDDDIDLDKPDYYQVDIYDRNCCSIDCSDLRFYLNTPPKFSCNICFPLFGFIFRTTEYKLYTYFSEVREYLWSKRLNKKTDDEIDFLNNVKKIFC